MEQPTKEQILEAAKTSPEAKEALTKLFPTVFEDEKSIDLRKLIIDGYWQIFTLEQAKAAGVDVSNLKHKAFYLCDDYNWEFERDNGGYLCLIPTRK